MKKYKIPIFLTILLLSGLLGIAVSWKNPLSLIFDVSIFLIIVGLVSALICLTIGWFNKSMIKRIFAVFSAILSITVSIITLIIIVDFRLLLPRLPSRPITKFEWVEDFEVLRTSMETHPAYTDSIGGVLELYCTQLKNKPAITDQQALITSLKMVSLLNDAHSQVMPLQLYFEGPQYLPIQTHFFEDGLFVTNAIDKNLLGAEIININNRPIGEIYNQIRPLIGADNKWGARFHSGLYLPNMEILSGLGITENNREARVEFLIDGRPLTKKIKSVSAVKWAIWSIAPSDEIRPVSWNLRNSDNKVELKSDTLIWMTFHQTFPEENLTQIGNQIYDWSVKKEIKGIVIDLRNNTGGNNYTYNTLIQRLTETDAPLTLMTSRKTYSAAINFISELLLTNRKFKIIGEPTGAGHNHSGDPNTLFLPNSGMMVNLSTKAWNFIPELTENQIRPDVMIRYTSSDYFDFNDPWMEALHHP